MSPLHTYTRARLAAGIFLGTLLAACASAPPGAPSPGQPVPPASGGTQPQPGGPVEQPAPTTPSRPQPKQFHLGPATTALVAQAHKQSQSGDFGTAAITLERALRIEPSNPLLWIELGQVRLGEGNTGQADSMGRKALALATGDPQAQSSAWRLIAEALRERGRNQEAADADRRSAELAAR
jgi:Tfp pilus assembly protein PilF